MATTELQANGDQQALRQRGTSELIKDLSDQASTLVRQEIDLAKAEVAEKAKQVGVGAGVFGAAGVAALMTLGSLTAFVILVLALALPSWAAALIVTLVWAAIAGTLALIGHTKLREIGKPAPQKTVETLKEDVQWLKNRK